MKTPIELLNELNEVRKEYPGLYDASKVDDCILVAAIIQPGRESGGLQKVQACRVKRSGRDT
jgi:hypothetical protein